MRRGLAEDTVPEIANPPETARPRPRLVPPQAPRTGSSGPAPRPRPVSAGPRASSPQLRPLPPPVAEDLHPSVAELPAELGSEVRRKSYAAAPRPVRPLAWNGAPPTVIRDLDALFAADRAKRETSRPPPRPAPSPSAGPIEPAQFARLLLQKVQADFTPAIHVPAAAAPAPVAPAPVVQSASVRAAFVVFTPPGAHLGETMEMPLPADDEDLAALVPWYRRLWSRIFG